MNPSPRKIAKYLSCLFISACIVPCRADTQAKENREFFRYILQNPLYSTADKAKALDSLIKQSTHEKDWASAAGLLQQKGSLRESEGQYILAKECYQEALEYSQQAASDRQDEEILYRLARICFYQGDYEESTQHLYHILDNSPDPDLQIRAHAFLSMVFINLNQLPLAEKHILQAEVLLDSANLRHPADTNTLFIFSNHKSALLYEQGRYQEAIEEMKRTETYAIALKQTAFLTTHNQNMALLYLKTGQKELAKDLFFKIIDAYQREGNLSQNYVLCLQNIAEIYTSEKDYGKALEYYRIALEATKRNKLLHNQSSILIHMSSIYAGQGDYHKAWDYLFQGSTLKDSVTNLQIRDKAMQADLEHEQKESLLQQQILQSEYLEAKLKNRNKTLFLIAGIASLAFLSFLVQIYRHRLKSQENTNQKLHKALNKLQERNLEEKQRLTHQYQEDIEYKNKNLAKISLMLSQQNHTLEYYGQALKKMKSLSTYADCKPILQEMEKMLRIYDPDQIWQEFSVHFEELHPRFFQRLQSRYPNLTPNESRICALLFLNMSNKEIASITHRSARTVEAVIYQIRKKLNIPLSERTQSFLLNALTEE